MAGRSKTANLLRASTGGEMRGELSARLPAIKAKVKERLARKTGRPSTYDPKLGERIFELMAEGYSLTEACDELGLARGTVYGWAEKDESFATFLIRAREALAEHSFSEAFAIPRRLLALYDDEPDLKLDPARVSAAKLATDTLKWYSERLAPRTFADKTRKVEISGPNGAPIQVAALTVNAESLTDEQRAILRLALARAKTDEPIDGSFTEAPEEN